jgi:hypothetical protein
MESYCSLTALADAFLDLYALYLHKIFLYSARNKKKKTKPQNKNLSVSTLGIS